MRGLQVERGFPVPFIVLRLDGVVRFAVNDTRRVIRCIKEKRCAICGNPLDRLMWFVGGPGSAFARHGAFVDTAMHHECMEYALRVCPYLAAPSLMAGRATERAQAQLAGNTNVIVYDPTSIPGRPEVFVAAATRGYTPNGDTVTPVRPYIDVEYWKHGERIDAAEGVRISLETMRRLHADYPHIEIDPDVFPPKPR